MIQGLHKGSLHSTSFGILVIHDRFNEIIPLVKEQSISNPSNPAEVAEKLKKIKQLLIKIENL